MPIAAAQPERKENGAKPRRNFDDYLRQLDDFIQASPPAELKPVLAQAQESIKADAVWRKGVEPLSFDEFVKTVSGSDLTPRQVQAFTVPNMLKASSIIAGDRPLQEIILMYGKGAGKDWLAALFIAYLAYLVCELAGDPAVFFGMAAFSQMSVLNVAPSEDLARQVFFRYLTQNVKHKLFDEYAPHILADEVRFTRPNPEDGKPSQFLCLYSKHSKSSGLDGYNLLGWVMDEADAFLDSADKSNADTVHNILRSSCNTRLKNRWVGLVISYPRVEGGFMMRLYDRATKEMKAMGARASFYADRAATWEVRPDVSREDPGIRADYDNDPISAAALYETIPANTIDAFFEFAERIDAAVKEGREPVAYVTNDHPLDMPSENGKQGNYITAILGRVNPVPGHSYFLGVDTGLVSDATALSIFHTNDTTEAIGYLCPACGTAENRQFASYVQQPTMTRVPYAEDVYCGNCYRTNFEWFETAPVPNALMRLDLWWVRGDIDAAEDGAIIQNGQGQAFDIPHVYEDLLVQIKPFRASRPGEVNRPVYFPGIQTLCQELIQRLNVRQTRLDPWNTAQITQNLIESTGGDIDKISFSAPDQYRRARLVKAMLYAGKITLLPNEARDREWKRLQRVGGNKVDHPKGVGECFVGDTRIPLLDGNCPTIAELDGKEVWVYSSTSEGKIVPGKAKGRKTKMVTELLDVVLDSGAVVRCTRDHPFMLRDGSYKPASLLRPAIDRLMPINRAWPVNGGYERVVGMDGVKRVTHRLIAEHIDGEIPADHVVHHKNSIKTDNRPENLECVLMTSHSYRHTVERWESGEYAGNSEKRAAFLATPLGLALRKRWAEGTSERHASNPVYRESVRAGIKKFNESPEGRRKHSEAMKRTVSGMTREDHLANCKKRATYRSDITPETLESAKLDPAAINANCAARVMGCGRNTVVSRLKEMGYMTWENFLNGEKGCNHKVRYLIPVVVDEPVWVYDLEVEQWDNFALSCGIFVHNSKDLYDSESVAIWCAATSKCSQLEASWI